MLAGSGKLLLENKKEMRSWVECQDAGFLWKSLHTDQHFKEGFLKRYVNENGKIIVHSNAKYSQHWEKWEKHHCYTQVTLA